METLNGRVEEPNATGVSIGEPSRTRSGDADGFGEAPVNDELLGFCEHDGEMHILTISREMKLEELYDKVKEKWAEISQDNTTLHYLEPEGGFKVELRSEADVEHMWRVHVLLKKVICKMVASLVMSPNKRPWYGKFGVQTQAVNDVFRT